MLCAIPLADNAFASKVSSTQLSALRRPPLDKLLQILPRRHTQHKTPTDIGDDRKVLLLPARRGALKERLELLQRRVHGDDLVLAALALEPRHGGRQRIRGLGLATVEQRLQRRDADVAE